MFYSNTLNLIQVGGGTQVKQGDLGSRFSYKLANEKEQELDVFDKEVAHINLVLDDKIVFTTTATVDNSTVTFNIDKAIPVGLYFLEIKIRDYIFPSDKQTIIFVQSGAVAYDLKDLVPNYDTNMTLKGILSDLSQKGIDISDLNRRIGNVNAQLAKKANKDEVTNVITPKGTLAYASLPTSGNQVGWYYYCPDGDGTHGAGNYVWNGSSWYFGGTGDEGYNLLKKDLDYLNNSIIDDLSFEDKIIRSNLSIQDDDSYITSEEITLNIGETIFVYGFAYNNAVSVVTEFLNGTAYKMLVESIGTITSGKGSRDWYRYTNSSTDKMIVKVCIQNTGYQKIFKSFNNSIIVEDITDFVSKNKGYISNNLSIVREDGYFYTNPIKLIKGTTVRFLNWSYKGHVSMITLCSEDGTLIESKAISESNYDWYEYKNNSDIDQYIILSCAVSTKKPAKIQIVFDGYNKLVVFPENTTFVDTIKNLNTGIIYDGGLSGTPNNYAVYLENGVGRQLCIIPIEGNTKYTIVKSDIGSTLRVQTAKTYTEPTTTDTLLNCGEFSTNSNSKELIFTSGADDKYLYIQFDRASTGITLQVFKGCHTKESLILKGFDIYSNLDIDNKFGESSLKILHMGDSLTALKNYPSLIYDGNEHINVSVAGATIVPKVGDNFEGGNFKSLVDSMVSGDFTLIDRALSKATEKNSIINMNTFKITDYSKLDKCVFWYGMNDYLQAIELGESGSTDYTKVIPSLEYCLSQLSQNFPRLELYCVNVSYTNRETNRIGLKITDYGNAIKTVCEKFGVPIYDMYHCGGVNSINHTSRLSDGIHQNDFQNKIVARKIMTFMRDN